MEKQLSDFSITELKAIAYDQMALIEQCQTNLRSINQELGKRLQPPPNQIDPLPPGSIQSV